MSPETIIILFVALLGAATLLAGRAGIRSIQRARKVVFYRTRKTYMLAGWQWLLLALVLFSSTVASALFGEPVANQIFSPTDIPVSLPVSVTPLGDTPIPSATVTRTLTATRTAGTSTVLATDNGTEALTQTATDTRTATVTPTQTPPPTRTPT